MLLLLLAFIFFLSTNKPLCSIELVDKISWSLIFSAELKEGNKPSKDLLTCVLESM